MAKIAFILLCHKDPEAIIDQAERLTAAGDCMSIHFDASAESTAFKQIKTALSDNPNVTFAKKRVRCGWGEWSLVQATLHAIEAALDEFPRATHFYMLSGDCMAIKSAQFAHEFLDASDADFIESFDFFASDWIQTGMRDERLIYRHWFNERTQKRLFYTSYELQKSMGWARKVPDDLQMMIGSQWWCLRRRTVEWVLDFIKSRKDVLRFFRTTWIPDETFFQTMVRHLVPSDEITTRSLTFLMFTDYGMPATFYNDHYDLLLSQDFLFARKVSPDALDLKARLGDLYASEQMDFQTSNEGRTLFKFLTGQGRIGRRFAPRFWEQAASLGRDRTLYVIACKKWHVAKRLRARISEKTGLRGVEYLFDEEGAGLPDLGGIQTSLDKRTRHRRSLMRLLFEAYGTDHMTICLDPSNLDLLRDLFADSSTTKLLEIECSFGDEYLLGHAIRVGLAGETTPQDTIDRLLPTVRQNFAFETDQIRDAEFLGYSRVSEYETPEANIQALAAFLDVPADAARDILDVDYLFKD
ncbi:MAG: DUF5928 domain-containing protein [Pseudomonadota bacterium]